MVSISNPSVTVSDVWNYSTRELTNSGEDHLSLINTLLNSVLGQEFDQDSYGYFITKGIAQTVIDAMNDKITYNHSLILPTSQASIDKILTQSACTGGISKHGNSYGASELAPSYSQGNIIIDGFSSPPLIKRMACVFNKTNGDCVADMTKQIEMSTYYIYSNYRFCEPEIADKIDLLNDTFLVCWGENTNGRSTWGANFGYYTINYDKASSIIQTPNQQYPVKFTLPFVNTLALPSEITITNYRSGNIDGLYISFPTALPIPLKAEILNGSTVLQSIEWEAGKDNYKSPPDMKIDVQPPTSTLKVRLSSSIPAPWLPVAPKSIILTESIPKVTT